MSNKSKIDWTDATWNPVVGCTKCSLGCQNCYAERMAFRLACMGIEKYEKVSGRDWAKKNRPNEVFCDESVLDKPLHWRKPRKIFVCSMSDLFHPKVPFEFIDKVRKIIWRCPQHTFQILTKRAIRLNEYCKVNNQGTGVWPTNTWLGVTVCTQPEADEKIPILLQIPAAVRFVSIEPMLEGIRLNQIMVPEGCERHDGPWMLFYNVITGQRASSPYSTTQDEKLDWVIVGAESGPKRRPCKIEWIDSIVDQCKAANVPIFVKQIHKDGKLVKMPAEYPQEYPQI